MSTIDYGMYGYSVVNSNGETYQLPRACLTNLVATAVNNPAVFIEVASDDYGMVIPNGGNNTGGYSAIRTLVAGTYEITASILYLAGAGNGIAVGSIIVDKQALFDANGLYIPGSTTNAYTVADGRTTLLSGARGGFCVTLTLFLEKDCYVSVYSTTGGGTTPSVSDSPFSKLEVRCIAVESGNKTSYQNV